MMKTIQQLTPYARAVLREKEDAMLSRAGLVENSATRDNVYRTATLSDLAKESVRASGIDVGQLSPLQLVSAAFTQTDSDFPLLIESVMHRALQIGYKKREHDWRRFCRIVDLKDFRDHRFVRWGGIGTLDAKNAGGEFVNKTIPDAESDTLRAGTKGNVINISRQTILNDDLNAFVSLAAQLGESAARTIEADVFAVLALNGGMGPVLNDGFTLFHASHKNIVAPSGAPSVATFSAVRTAFSNQTEPGTADSYLALSPAVWLGPLLAKGAAREINNSEFDPDTANLIGRRNEVQGVFSDVIGTPRLIGTRWYGFADPAQIASLQVGFIGGSDEPTIDLEQGFDVDGVRARIYLDFGVGGGDPRGAITNAGA